MIPGSYRKYHLYESFIMNPEHIEWFPFITKTIAAGVGAYIVIRLFGAFLTRWGQSLGVRREALEDEYKSYDDQALLGILHDVDKKDTLKIMAALTEAEHRMANSEIIQQAVEEIASSGPGIVRARAKNIVDRYLQQD